MNDLDRFLTYVNDSHLASKVPGLALAIIEGNKVIHSQGFGCKKIGSKQKVDQNTAFQIGSISKSFTASLIGMLVDEKELTWQTKVIDILPDFRLYDPWVTRELQVEDLLCHRLGLPAQSGTVQAFLGYSRQHMIESLQYIEPSSSFRSSFAYQNTTFLAAAAIAEKITGKSWEKLLAQKIFMPLSMKNVSASLAEYLKAPNRAALHVRRNKKLKAIANTWPYFNWPYIYGPAGGINASVTDLAKWLILQNNHGRHKNRQLISPITMNYLHKAHIIATANLPIDVGGGGDYHYGLGWMRRAFSPHPIIWHAGSTFGAISIAAFIPQDKIGVTMLTNSNSILPYALAWKFFDIYYNNPNHDWFKDLSTEMAKLIDTSKNRVTKLEEKVKKSCDLECYTGNYENKMYGKVKVTTKNHHLILAIGPNKTKLQLKPLGNNKFFIIWPKLDEFNYLNVQFTFAGGDQSSEFVIDLFGEPFKRCTLHKP